MKQEPRHFTTELAVIGSGLAGFAASIFALNRQIRTAQVGNTGSVAYTTGYLDLLGRHDGVSVGDPWAALQVLRQTEPQHPLNRIAAQDIRRAFAEFTAFLGEAGLHYTVPGDANLTALTPVGTLKQTLCVPATMAAGPQALAKGEACVIIDIHGLKGFSGAEIVANLRQHWPALATQRITFPDMAHGEVYPEVMARALQVPATRVRLAELLKAAAGSIKVIGVPAMLGMHHPDQVHAELERLSGLRIFEIPTMPPSVAGLRLRELFEQALPRLGATLIPQQKVTALRFADDGATLALKDSYGDIRIHAQAVILATGRFLSGGLDAHPDGVREHLLDLPVTQPACRSDWYRVRYTDPQGHPVNRAGIEVDDQCRPLAQDGNVYNERLFAAGALLAHHDWIRSRSGAGIALATAWQAVGAVERFLTRQAAKALPA
jgi:glycerol-3-phosphate dehydrogenase subunit B